MSRSWTKLGAAVWLLLSGAVAVVRPAQERIANGIVFPADSGVLNVRDYGAKGDGITDDTAAIQEAVREAFEHGGNRYACPAFVYLPNGTYLVSDTIEGRVSHEGWSSGWRAGNILFGESRDKTIIRLRDSAPGFGDPDAPKPVIANGSEADRENPAGGGNRAFLNSVLNLTMDVGDGNPGAVGIDWVASNRGTVEDVLIRAGEGSGAVGLLLDRWWPGPCLAKRVTIEGFDYGITARSHYQYGVTFEHIELRGQRVAGILNQRNVLHMRGLVSRNAVPAIRIDERHGHLTLIEALLEGGSDVQPAIVNHGKLFLRDVTCSGYGVAIEDLSGDEPRVTEGGDDVRIGEYVSHKPVTLFESPDRSLRLPVKETPEFHAHDTGQWASVTQHGAKPGASFMRFDTPAALERIDAAVDFDWGEGGPIEEIGRDQFSARWTGEVEAPTTGTYAFHTVTDDGVRLWVNGELLIDQWEPQGATEHSGSVALHADTWRPIRMEYFERSGGAVARLLWTPPGGQKQVVPAENLRSPEGADGRKSGLKGQYFTDRTIDNSNAIQAAIDSGKPIVYLPNGVYPIRNTIVMRGNVRKIIGMQSWIRAADGATVEPLIRFEGCGGEAAVVEHISMGAGTIDHASDKALAIRHCDVARVTFATGRAGDLFAEDTIGPRMTVPKGRRVWCRQLNVEFGEVPLVENHGGDLWILGMKTEGQMTCIKTVGGATELLGALLYPLAPPSADVPCFINDGGRVSLTYALNHENYPIHVRERRGNEWRDLRREDAPWRGPALYVGHDED